MGLGTLNRRRRIAQGLEEDTITKVKDLEPKAVKSEKEEKKKKPKADKKEAK